MPAIASQKKSKIKVIVGMSGGVDSSVAALLLQQQGYQVEGLFMKNWEEDDNTEYCTAKQDFADAQAVCDKLNIPLHSANFAAEYWNNVFENFLAEYRAGRTPNPDILCNREIKFKAFLDYALELGAQLIATGHYVRRSKDNKDTRLLKGLDNNKDQSYFLYQVGQAELAKSLFPVGELEKTTVRALAEKYGLITHNKKDSTGICFIGERRFTDFLARYLPAQPGQIRTLEGEVIGQHNGLMYYTIGQRQGLQIGGLKNYPELPWFAADKDLENNVLIAVQGKDNPALLSSWLKVGDIFWINKALPEFPLRCKAKIRYRQMDQPCIIEPDNKQGYTVRFDTEQRAVTLGQSLVIYQNDVCLGGGIIENKDLSNLYTNKGEYRVTGS